MDGLSHDQHDGMTSANESPTREVSRKKPSLLRPKSKIKVGAWNVRTMYEVSKSAQVTNTMQQYDIDILGVSECRWTGSGRMKLNSGHTILYSGHQSNHI